MSADNGIYILESDDGYRITHAQAIENITYDPDDTGYNQEWVKCLFGDCKVFSTIDQARDEAWRLYNEIMESDFPIVEYGISTVGYLPTFPKE
jgi:hypothetical protein